MPDERGRTARPEPDCPVEVALAAIAGRWTTLVLRELMHGSRSFGELRAALPALSAKVLTERLRELAARGLVDRRRTAGFPVRTSYQLTPAGQLLRPLLVALYQTGTALLDTTMPGARGA
ncbi:winged helix-turn-helix transcriptional regulator [Goodfellowiella coeruleoviolacea]|uniref:Transcriptional regulator, HxlR family n=1 Tax=Goodfellowiella coeruleoviolacea TaxID=334858 RepID=A0AAE3GC19_9PSEU|nr:helix-turn-helix domain-containing protein [Goodfellowiella coeruleoviolacea]MCP2165466.1 transcriptional regulator, HxlR family [Goodfellowiella coeruleoviolacea]